MSWTINQNSAKKSKEKSGNLGFQKYQSGILLVNTCNFKTPSDPVIDIKN